jgi:TolB protein
MQLTASRSRRTSSRRFSLALLLAAAALPFLWEGTRAQQPPVPTGTPVPQIDILGQGTQRVAVPNCVPRPGDEAARTACQTITDVLRNDLRFENVRFVPESLMSAIPAQDPDAPNFVDWEGIQATFLVTTRVQVTGGDLAVDAKFFFVPGRQNVLGKRFNGRADNPRLFAHQISDEFIALATQGRGVARTKIAFVSDRDGGRSKELYIMDYDGYNPRRMTVNRSINILPNWSPDGKSLAYTSYRRARTPDIYVASIYEGKSSNLTAGGAGNSFAPSYSPDGKRITYASSRGGNMEIWLANADGSGARRLTSSPGLDTAPTWSPTGQEIAFTSDRAGTPQIYLMDSEGLNVRRLTTVGNWNDAPSWNPSKVYSEIAYTARIEGGFEIAVIDLATRQVRQITQGRGSCEYPSWAPSGRHLVFACGRGGRWQIAVADRDGRSVQHLPAGPGKNEQPDWGP